MEHHSNVRLFQGQTSASQDGRSQEPVSVFTLNAAGRFELRDGVQLHMFISQPPCGDACIFQSLLSPDHHSSKQDSTWSDTEDAHTLDQPRSDGFVKQFTEQCIPRRRAEADPVSRAAVGSTSIHDTDQQGPLQSVATKRLKSHSNRTGTTAPLQTGMELPVADEANAAQHNTQQDRWQVAPGTECEQGQQQVGMLRRKPGRGDATLSMSCSDKLARWGLLGIQVITSCCLLSLLVQAC